MVQLQPNEHWKSAPLAKHRVGAFRAVCLLAPGLVLALLFVSGVATSGTSRAEAPQTGTAATNRSVGNSKGEPADEAVSHRTLQLQAVPPVENATLTTSLFRLSSPDLVQWKETNPNTASPGIVHRSAKQQESQHHPAWLRDSAAKHAEPNSDWQRAATGPATWPDAASRGTPPEPGHARPPNTSRH